MALVSFLYGVVKHTPIELWIVFSILIFLRLAKWYSDFRKGV